MTSTPPPRCDRTPDPSRWATAVREVIRLRREEAAADRAAEDALADDLHRVFHGDHRARDHRQPSTP